MASTGTGPSAFIGHRAARLVDIGLQAGLGGNRGAGCGEVAIVEKINEIGRNALPVVENYDLS